MFVSVLIFLDLLVALTHLGDSLESHISICDKVEPIQHFDAKKIEGVWYVQEYDGYGENFLGDCLKFDITGVNGLVIFSDRIYREYINVNMTIVQEGNTSEYIFTIDPNNGPLTYYWVDTDYDNFAIYYTGCKKKETVIILTRTRNQKAEIIKKAKEVMKKKGFTTDKMTAVKQNDCTN